MKARLLIIMGKKLLSRDIKYHSQLTDEGKTY